MIRLVPKVIKNESLYNERFVSLIRQRFLELYKQISGQEPSTDFILMVNKTGSKIYLELMSNTKRNNVLISAISEGEFRNEVSVEEFFNITDENKQENNFFSMAMDKLMEELPSLITKSQEDKN